jgi:phosphate/sulfate permease
MTLVYGMLAALLSAGTWIQIASYKGWPVATTHCIIGAIVGFGAIVGGWEAIHWDHVLTIAFSWILSPLVGGIISFSIFNFLRRNIFYAPDPLETTRQVTPLLIFIVLTTLCLVMCYNGLGHLHITLSFLQALGISTLLGSLGSVISCIYLNRMTPPISQVKVQEEYHPEMAGQLEKAKKHLVQMHLLARGVTQFQVSELLSDVENLSQSLKRTEETGKLSAEYTLIEKVFGYLQVISACFMAFAHGANDVANAIGPLSAAIGVFTTGTVAVQTNVPTWALSLGGFGIVIGLSLWGWRVIETIGKKITELTPTRGFAAEFGAAATILMATRLGLPISTTHTLIGSVIGVGMARGIEALDLGTIRPIVLAWVMTVPAGALITIVYFFIIQAIFG